MMGVAESASFARGKRSCSYTRVVTSEAKHKFKNAVKADPTWVPRGWRPIVHLIGYIKAIVINTQGAKPDFTNSS